MNEPTSDPDAGRMAFLQKLADAKVPMDKWDAEMVSDLLLHPRPLNGPERQWADDLQAKFAINQ